MTRPGSTRDYRTGLRPAFFVAVARLCVVGFFVVFVGRTGMAPLAPVDFLALPAVGRVLVAARPRTVRVPGAGTKTDWSPVAHCTVIMRPRTSVTMPLRVAWLTFVAAT